MVKRAAPPVGGDGLLRLPEEVAIGRSGDHFLAALGAMERDPFQDLDTKLYLAEEFARADLSGEAGRVWRARYGMVHPRKAALVQLEDGSGQAAVVDRLDESQMEQRNVVWHLEALANLSDHLPDEGGTPADVPHGWEARWTRPAIGTGPWLVWRTGVDDFARVAWDTERARAEGWTSPPDTDDDPWMWSDWLPEAEAVHEEIVRGKVPTLFVRDPTPPDWRHPPPEFTPDRFLALTSHLTEGLGTGWWDLVELERRLIEPYVRRAMTQRVDLVLRLEPGSSGQAGGSPWPSGPLLVLERRVWASVLAPIYLQLLGALQRVTEGRPAARRCKECGRPFLIADERRSTFCNRAHQNRAAQRALRRQSGAKPRHPSTQP